MASGKALEIAISGASGLVGTALTQLLTQKGHVVKKLVRSATEAPNTIRWNPESSEIDLAQLEGLDALVHLAGEGIADHRWSEKQKIRIEESRSRGTRLIAESLARLKTPPSVFVSTSAIGIYGTSESAEFDESSPTAEDFLAGVCKKWEAATQPAAEANIRTVILRLGIVLSTKGGALAKMLTPFKLGAGGRVGSGEQWMSWVALDDVAFAYAEAVTNPSLSGVYNVVAPEPVRNRDFTKALGHALHRPSFAPLPAFMVKLLFGEMGQELLLKGQRVLPKRLAAAGFQFTYPKLAESFQHLLSASAT